jgi:HK97 family phage prohead protease
MPQIGEIERRIMLSEAQIEYRAGENGEKRPVISGYGAVFHSESRNLGGFVETIHPSAFDEVLSTKPDVIGVFNHDRNLLLGRTSNGTMRLMTDAYGLRYEITPNTNTSIGKDVTEWVKDRTVVGSSFAFAISRDGKGDSWTTDERGMRRREVRNIALLEDVGPVARPAYDSSSVVVSRRAIEQAMGESFRPTQTMANSSKRGLKLADRNDGVDQVLVGIAARIAAREIVSAEEVGYLAGVFERCLAAKATGWSGTPAWVEWQLAGGDTGSKWVQRRSELAAPSETAAAPAPAAENRASDISLKPTGGMASACRRGLKLYEDGRGGDGLVPETISWAKKIAAGESLTQEKVVKMAAWHARHKVDRRPGWDKAGDESAGFVANLLWAGAAGARWSQSKVNQLRKAGEVRDMEDAGDDYEAGLDDRQMATAEAYESIEEEMGQWSREEAHYVAENPFASKGIKCQNCVFFKEGACELVGGQIAANAVCKLWVIPEDKMSSEEKQPEQPVAESKRSDVDGDAATSKAAALKATILRTQLHGNTNAQ